MNKLMLKQGFDGRHSNKVITTHIVSTNSKTDSPQFRIKTVKMGFKNGGRVIMGLNNGGKQSHKGTQEWRETESKRDSRMEGNRVKKGLKNGGKQSQNGTQEWRETESKRDSMMEVNRVIKGLKNGGKHSHKGTQEWRETES